MAVTRKETIMKNDRIRAALIGAGRIGQEHARNLVSLPQVEVAIVCDPRIEAAKMLLPVVRAEKVTDSTDEVLSRSDIDSVIICTPTDTHAALIEAAAEAGKAIFCEKPVALELGRTQKALAKVAEKGVPFQIGFQRRFDTGYAEAKRRIEERELGRLDQFRTVGRDPGPPPREYLEKCGGLFLDQAIHEFDIARFLMGDVTEVSAWGTVRFHPDAQELGDVDTATTFLRFSSGALGVVENSRQAVYGYDIVTEVFGENGKLVIQAEPKTPLRHYHKDGYKLDHYHFFMDRFGPAFRAELEGFFNAIANGNPPSPGSKDALESLKIALAATRSLKESRSVKLTEIEEINSNEQR
jgi:myo-inositol 2-dehydrogenase/D-chiro-inositol 1-dehydrogenase